MGHGSHGKPLVKRMQELHARQVRRSLVPPYECPSCHQKTLSVRFKLTPTTLFSLLLCPCGLADNFRMASFVSVREIDIYNRWMDAFRRNGNKCVDPTVMPTRPVVVATPAEIREEEAEIPLVRTLFNTNSSVLAVLINSKPLLSITLNGLSYTAKTQRPLKRICKRLKIPVKPLNTLQQRLVEAASLSPRELMMVTRGAVLLDIRVKIEIPSSESLEAEPVEEPLDEDEVD